MTIKTDQAAVRQPDLFLYTHICRSKSHARFLRLFRYGLKLSFRETERLNTGAPG
ncbi:MAG: hypothetical protein H6Q60_734 [Oscillospiraceae bacterium]|nr:hypothetical protein [Oscillospiraceae bacterium]